MARTDVPNPAANVSAMASNGRTPVGNSVPLNANNQAVGSSNTKAVRRKGSQAADPTGTNARHRSGREALGASYMIKARYNAPMLPEAAATQAGGRLMPSAINRSQGADFHGALDIAWR